ncbi:MAG: S8 family serine peptidase [Thermoplasmata archaeon]
MRPDGDLAWKVRHQVRMGRLRKSALVLAALIVAGSLLASMVASGIISVPLDGVTLSRDSAWVMRITQAERLWDMGYDGTGVTICLVDTGIDSLHPDLARARIAAWKDLVSGERLPYDDGGHGTAMAGLMVADGRFRGLAPGASLIVVKALRSNGTGSSETVGRAIGFCMDPDGDGDLRDGADIISLSLGAQRTPFTTNAAANAAEEATLMGIFVVSSAGNDGREDDGDVGTPANEPLVMAVGSLNHRLEIAAFSSKGNNSPLVKPPRLDPHRKPEFVLPGVGLMTTARGSSYTVMTGTSASAALLSALLALLLQAHPEYRKAGAEGLREVKMVLMHTSLRLPGQQLPHDDYYGYGLVQVSDAHLLLNAYSEERDAG